MKIWIFTVAIILSVISATAQRNAPALKKTGEAPAGFETSLPHPLHPYVTQMAGTLAAHKATATKSRLISKCSFNADGQNFVYSDSITYTFASGRGGDLNSSPLKFDTYNYFKFSQKDDSFTNTSVGVSTYDAAHNLLQIHYTALDNVSKLWINSTRRTYTYDGQNRMLTDLNEKWDVNTAMWINNSRNTYAYDAQGNTILYQYETWDKINNVWKGNSKYEYIFNGTEMQSYTYYGWDNIAKNWKLSTLYEYTYDPNNGLVKQELSKSRINNAWEDNGVILYGYDNKDLLASYTNANYNKNTQTWDSSEQYIYTHSTKGLETEYVYYIWAGTKWEKSYRMTTAYGPNDKKTEEMHYNWDNVSTKWNNNYKAIFQYDASDNLIDETQSKADANDNTKWVNYIRILMAYNSYNQLLSNEEQTWSGTKWELGNNDNKHTYRYEDYQQGSSVKRFNNLAAEINLYPNPAAQFINLELSLSQLSPISVVIVNMNGAKMIEGHFPESMQLDYRFDIGSLPTGMYQCIISTKDGQRCEKISIVK